MKPPKRVAFSSYSRRLPNDVLLLVLADCDDLGDVHLAVEQDEVNEFTLSVEINEAEDVVVALELALALVDELRSGRDHVEQLLRWLLTRDCRWQSAEEDQEEGEEELLHNVSPWGIPR